jgi:hypothetical protein
MTITRPSRQLRRRRAVPVIAALAALALAGAACGDDDDAATGTPTGGTTSTTAADGDTAAFCTARVELEAQFNSDQPEPQAVTGLLDDLASTAPSDLAANVEGLSSVLADALESGGDPTEDPAFTDNIGPIDEFALAECGYDEVDVTAVDYSYEGLPASIDAGTVGFKLTNEGTEPHVMVLFRFDDGDTTSVADLLALPDDQVAQHGTFSGATFADPGSWGAGFLQLDPGRYAVFCPIPSGADGPPHFMQGMEAELEVT